MSKEIKSNMAVVPVEWIEKKIYLIRGHKVMLDSDLAKLYGVSVKVLNQAVKRNISRFPEDFMFQLTKAEYDSLRSQIVTLKTGRGRHRKYLPYVFTEQGVAMLSSVLRSERAIEFIEFIGFIGLRVYGVENGEWRRKDGGRRIKNEEGRMKGNPSFLSLEGRGQR